MKSLTQPFVVQNSYTSSPSLPKRELEIRQKLNDFVKDHPCLGAHSVFNLSNYEIGIYSALSDESCTTKLGKDLTGFILQNPSNHKYLYSFLAIFAETPVYTETQFEEKLWEQLSKLVVLDKKPWDSSVSSDPNDPNFSFSFGEKAFYVIGMHPNSSRKARRFSYPMIVFNYHEQFERLRESGVYSKMRDKIRSREMNFSGSVNPMLEDFGKASEARQYSGRKVDKKWKCPFFNNEM